MFCLGLVQNGEDVLGCVKDGHLRVRTAAGLSTLQNSRQAPIVQGKGCQKSPRVT